MPYQMVQVAYSYGHWPLVCTSRAMILIDNLLSSLTRNQEVIHLGHLHSLTACTRWVYNPPVCGMTLHSAQTAAAMILGVILCAWILLLYSVIDALLVLPQHRPSCKSISCLRYVFSISDAEGVHILHPSFHDYLLEQCSAKPWSINLELHNKELTLCCTKLLDNKFPTWGYIICI
jgi:hypothetical protein